MGLASGGGCFDTELHFFCYKSPRRESSSGVAFGLGRLFLWTTPQGGTFNLGTIIRVSSSGTLTKLIDFNSTNGSIPTSGLIQATDGNFYGTTEYRGSSSMGSIFQLTPTGTLTTLVNFSGANGANPAARLLLATDGNFYGSTQYGGTLGDGTLFQLTPGGVLND